MTIGAPLHTFVARLTFPSFWNQVDKHPTIMLSFARILLALTALWGAAVAKEVRFTAKFVSLVFSSIVFLGSPNAHSCTQVGLSNAEDIPLADTEVEDGRASLRELKSSRLCTNRCVRFCAGRTGDAARSCAKAFVVNKCPSFGTKVTKIIKANCATDAQCTGGRRCSDKLCVRLPGQCCNDEKLCGTGTCSAIGTTCPPAAPTKAPAKSPTKLPTKAPSTTKAPSKAPVKSPTKAPSLTKFPTKAPTKAPTRAPTKAPTKAPA
jgi:hypothetical protein